MVEYPAPMRYADQELIPDDVKNFLTNLANAASSVHTTQRERAALRFALADAATLCDFIADRIRKTHAGRQKSGLSREGDKLNTCVKSVGDAIWKMREQIDVPHDEQARRMEAIRRALNAAPTQL